VYAYVIGGLYPNGNLGATFTNYWMDAQSNVHLMSASDTTPGGATGEAAGTFPNSGTLASGDATTLATQYPSNWANYAIPISTTTPTVLDLYNINATNISGLSTGNGAFSGRLYISIGVPILPFTPTSSSAYGGPGFVGSGSLFLFDYLEFSFDSTQAFNSNISQVQGVGLPMTLDGTPGGTTQGNYTVSRSALIGDILAQSGGYSDLAVANTTTSAYPAGLADLRVLSPQILTSTAYNGSLTTLFNTTIANFLTALKTQPLVTHDTATGYYTGMVLTNAADQGFITFFPGDFTTLTQAQAETLTPAFTVPASGDLTTYDVWQSSTSGAIAYQNVAKQIYAALNRGYDDTGAVALDDGNCPTPSTSYYQAGTTYNAYSGILHQYSANALAYGFPYDDVCAQNPSFTLTGTTGVTVTLGTL
jgi:hypothetical protein